MCIYIYICLHVCIYIYLFIVFLSIWVQNADASDEDEEGKPLMIKPGTSLVKEDKENDAFFKKVMFVLKMILMNMQISLNNLFSNLL